MGSGSRRLLVVWLILSGVTLLSLWMGSLGSGAPTPNALVTTGAILLALVKTRVIFREFMEVRHAPARLVHLTDAWLLLTGLGLLGTYFAGMGLAPG